MAAGVPAAGSGAGCGCRTPSALALWSRSAAVWAVVVPRSVLVLEGLDHRRPGFRRGNRVSARSMSFSGRNCAETRSVHRKRPRSRRWAPPLKVRGAHKRARALLRPATRRSSPARAAGKAYFVGFRPPPGYRAQRTV